MKPGSEPPGTLPVRRWAETVSGNRLLLVDSITQLEAGDAGAIVVTGSHGGRSSAAYAIAQPLRLVVFNDAGVGKDNAGIVALQLLQAAGCPAATVAHHSARIGEAQSGWEQGVLSHVNELAAVLGMMPGQSAKAAVDIASA